MQVGDLIAFITYTMQIISAFLMLSMTAVLVPRSIVSIRRINEVLKINTNVVENKKAKNIDKIESIEFKDVYFRYSDSSEDVLRNINFLAKKGTVTAFIGSTGSGKSTVVNLIPRLFDPTSGKILVNNVNLKDLKIKKVRSLIGYIPQKGKLFKGTIMDNISFGQTRLNKKLVLESAKMSESMEFINESLDKFNREISEEASNVSGGQKQRLSIARALAINPDVLIFDDSFSALDTKTDLQVRKNLKKIKKDKLIFIVAQRISTIMNADNIIVLNNGEIESMGTHEELLKNSKVYKEIYNSQLGGIENE